MIDDPFAAMVDMVAAEVTEMTDSITAVLAEIDVAGQAVVTALTAALAGTENLDDGTGATEGASFEPMNWAAYSHEELYGMLRDQADVGDVSEIAAEWGRHAEALAFHADAVRGQRAALTANWQGEVAERAVERIDQLADLIDAIGARAGQVRQAAQESADALALARNTMPAPFGPQAFTAAGGGSGAGTAASGADGSGGVVFAVGAVSAGGASMFDTDFLAGSGRSRAEEVMRDYESSLRGSDALIAPPVRTSAGSADLTSLTNAAGFVPGEGSPAVPGGGGGVPWSRLTHGVVPEPGGTPGRGPLPPDAGGPWSGGGRQRPGAGGLALRAAVNQLLALGRGPQGAGGVGVSPYLPPTTVSAGDKEHKRRQPNVGKGPFDDERTASKSTIGE